MWHVLNVLERQERPKIEETDIKNESNFETTHRILCHQKH